MNTGINRIRLEFKVMYPLTIQFDCYCINRIRLEFKVVDVVNFSFNVREGINRIRLEFKVNNLITEIS